jgi:cytochrome c biogenesis protein CcdA
MQLFYAVITLGLLGIDPLGAAVASSAVAAGIKKHKVLLFGLSYFFATAVIGVTLSFLGKEVAEYFHSLISIDLRLVRALLNIAIAIVVFSWLFIRFIKHGKSKSEKTPKKNSSLGKNWQAVVLGLIFAVSSFTDPTFYAVIMLAAESNNVFSIIWIHLLWIFVSQLPLVAVIIAYYTNTHEIIINGSLKLWHKYKNILKIVFYVVAALACLLLLTDSAQYFITGEFLF